MCEAGLIPAEFPLRETERDPSPDAPDVPRSQRTEWNVRDSDGTLVIAESDGNRSGCPTIFDAGTNWAMRCAERYARPVLVCDLSDPDAKEKILEWLRENEIKVLSVGGPAESTSPGIGERVYRLLRSVFDDL
jgi:hypothetical protein